MFVKFVWLKVQEWNKKFENHETPSRYISFDLDIKFISNDISFKYSTNSSSGNSKPLISKCSVKLYGLTNKLEYFLLLKYFLTDSNGVNKQTVLFRLFKIISSIYFSYCFKTSNWSWYSNGL